MIRNRIFAAAALLVITAAALNMYTKDPPAKDVPDTSAEIDFHGVVSTNDLQDLSTTRLVDLLGNELPWTRLAAAKVLAGRGQENITIFLTRLGADDWRVVRAAEDGILAMLKQAKKDAAGDDSFVRNAVIAEIPMLKRTLKHEHYYVRIGALQSLAALGPDAAVAGDAICDCTDDEDYLGVVPAAFKTIRDVGPENFSDERLFEVMEKSVRSCDIAARGAAIGLIEKLDETDQRKLIPAMLYALEHDMNDGYTRYHVQARIAKVLQKLDAEGALPRIIGILQIRGWGESHRVKQFMPILLKYGTEAKAALPALEEYIRIFEKRKTNSDLVELVKETMAVIKGENENGAQEQ